MKRRGLEGFESGSRPVSQFPTPSTGIKRLSTKAPEEWFDFDDPAIRALVERNHVPEEMWSTDGELVRVSCEQCGEEWPCPTIQKLREKMTGAQ